VRSQIDGKIAEIHFHEGEDVKKGDLLITIDPRLVRNVAAKAAADPSTVLGRALAHELGHLLMGTAEHSPRGLMRELWSQLELRQNNAADWCFLADQVAIMKSALTKELGN
jgi:multidrug efflux pump subunit AcrA (membrane-fusion protein)